MTHTEELPFSSIRARLLGRLLQLPFVRYHRVQLGVVEYPHQYERFVATVIAPRLEALPGRLGVFGVGTHTQAVLKALPTLASRVTCYTDNNPTLWHQTRFGGIVLPPAEAVKRCDAFLLSTAVFQRVLAADLRRLGFRGPLVAMDDQVAPAWFLGE